MKALISPSVLKGTLNADVPTGAPTYPNRATVTLAVTCDPVDAMTVFDALSALMDDLRTEVTR